MMAASGKWLGSSEVAVPTLGAATSGTAVVLSVGAVGHGSFADAMQRSADTVTPTVDVIEARSAGMQVAGVATTVGEEVFVAAMPQSGSTTVSAQPSASNAAMISEPLRAPTKASSSQTTSKEPSDVSVLVSPVQQNLDSKKLMVELKSRSFKTEQTQRLSQDNIAHVRRDVISGTEERASSTDGIMMDGGSPLVKTAAYMGHGNVVQGNSAGRNRVEDSVGEATVARATMAAKNELRGEDAATVVTQVSKPRSEVKGKTLSGKGYSGRAAVSSGGANAGTIGVSSAPVVVAVVPNVVVMPAAVMSGDVIGKETWMCSTGLAASQEGKVLVQADSATTSAGSGTSLSIAVNAVVDAKGIVEKVAANTTDVPVATVSFPSSVVSPVVVVVQGHPLNLLPAADIAASTHASMGVGAVASMQSGASSEVKLTTIETTKPNQLEVGLRGGELGWLKVRAELGANGEVNAFLRGATTASTDALQVQAPKIAAYLGANDVAVRAVHVESAQGNGGVGFGGGSGSGGAPQQQAFGGGQKSSANAAAHGEEMEVAEVGSEGVVPAALVLGRSVVSLTGTGNWLSVRA